MIELLFAASFIGTIQVGDVERTYWLGEPAQIIEGAPVWVGLHGANTRQNPGESFCKSHRFYPTTDARGSILVCPDALPVPAFQTQAWSNGVNLEQQDDVLFLEALVDHVRATYGSGPVYMVGFSSGGSMAARMLCESDVVDRLAFGGALLGRKVDCSPSPVPILEFHGTLDQFVPAGGDDKRRPFGETMRVLGSANGCDYSTIHRETVGPKTYRRWWDCDVPVTSYTIVDGVHHWSPDGIFLPPINEFFN